MSRRHYVSDPVLIFSDFRCVYCDKDLLGDVDTFLSMVKDHFIPKSIGGKDGKINRVASCKTCDWLKGHRLFASLKEARQYIATQRRSWELALSRIRAEVRGSICQPEVSEVT